MLIHGAGGGVGSVAVQLARAAGAHVLATGRAGARELVTELGVERFVDLDRERFEEVAEEVDLVVDLVGGETLRRSGATIRDGGIVVSAVEDPRATLEQASPARWAYFVVEPARSELEELARQADAGVLRPVVGEVPTSPTGARRSRPRRAGAFREGGASDLGPVTTGHLDGADNRNGYSGL